MIAGFVSNSTWLHRVPAEAKLVFVAASGFAVLPMTDWRYLAVGLSILLVTYASLGRETLSYLVLLKPLLPLLLALAVLQGLFESWPAAAASVLRILLMVAVASLVTLTTKMQDLIAALAPLFAPLRPLGISPRLPALAITLVLRFLPVLLEAWRQREEAWRARTGRRAPIRLIPAFLTDALRMADMVAEALDARGLDLSASSSQRAERKP
jgi:biotin transport system permease protein